MGGQTNRSSCTSAPRSNSAPKHSLHPTCNSVILWPCNTGGGRTSCACRFMSCSGEQGVKYDAFLFASHSDLVRFVCARADGRWEETHGCGATGAAASVPERGSERLARFRSSGPTGYAHVVVDERHIHHFRASGPRGRAGFYDSE